MKNTAGAKITTIILVNTVILFNLRPSSTLQILIYCHKLKLDESHFEKRQPGSKSDKVRFNAFMDERVLDEVRQKKEREKGKKKGVSAWVRLKTLTNAETWHTHIRVMDESCSLHNLWAARHVQSVALNVALPVTAPLPLRAQWRLSALTDWRCTGPRRRRVLPDWDEHLLSQSGLLAFRVRNLPSGD